MLQFTFNVKQNYPSKDGFQNSLKSRKIRKTFLSTRAPPRERKSTAMLHKTTRCIHSLILVLILSNWGTFSTCLMGKIYQSYEMCLCLSIMLWRWEMRKYVYSLLILCYIPTVNHVLSLWRAAGLRNKVLKSKVYKYKTKVFDRRNSILYCGVGVFDMRDLGTL